MTNFPPRIKKALRRYAEQAYEAEMGQALGELSAKFEAWKTGALTSAGLTESIHRFHDGPAVELDKKYNGMELPFVVADAIVSGILPRDKIEPEVLDHLGKYIAFLEQER